MIKNKGAEKKLFLGVAGNPVSASRSPEIFKEFFNLSGIEGSYIRVNINNAEKTVEIFKQLDFSAMNITAPFKTDIIQYIDTLSLDAKGSGAVNLIVNDKGTIKGYNTDHIGVVNSLKASGVKLKGSSAVVLGTGGAARGAVYGLIRSGAQVAISGRDEKKGEFFKKKFNVDFIGEKDLKEKTVDFDIVVNTIPVKWNYFNLSDMKDNSVFFNADYSENSEYTKNILEQKEILFISGYKWLFYQAVPSFNIISSHFFEKEITIRDNDLIDRLILAGSGRNRRRVFFTGFSGSGKTTLGKRIAEKKGYDFIDIDSLIEKKTDMKIRDIFIRYGENYFRDIETKTLFEIPKKDKILVSGGGGIVISEKNRKLMEKEFFTVWIYRDIKNIFDTTDDSVRPLAKGKSMTELRKLFNSRLKYYHSVSDILICNDYEDTDNQLFDLLNG